MSRNIYLASRFSNAELLRSVRDDLELHGHRVVSSWIDVPITADEDARRDLDVDPDERRHWANRDIEDLWKADTFILVDPSGKRGGCYVELGIAIASAMDCLIVGNRTNVFTYLCDHVEKVEDLSVALHG